MPRFRFRLQRVLEYRRLVEEWAEREYRGAQRARREADAERDRIAERRACATSKGHESLEEMLALERYLERLSDEVRAAESAIALLADEEARAKEAWISRRRDAEAFQKLHDSELDEWRMAAARREQAELDDWAAMRRRAA